MRSTTEQPTHPELAAAVPFIAPEYLTGDFFARMGDWYHGDEPHPLHLHNFLRPELAAAVSTAVRGIPDWSPHAALYEGRMGKTEFWDEEADAGHEVTISQLAVRDIPALLDSGAMDPAHQQVIEQFLAFALLSDTLRDWIKAGTGLELRKRAFMEIAAYRRSDGLGAHQDLVPGRVLAMNFYLDENYRAEHGGRLSFRDGEGREHHIEPVYNSLSIIPIREDCWHWVEPFSSDTVGRYTIAIGQHLEGS
ncbi:2OG-Fe(II) oxygenase [Streptomyces sp. B1I3]|uniref:2OG-Fe(II) oxygenase n=1 Tax=Streptomyces sp. B1I3 TaxID=3042264 RepID=UPI00278B0C0B|nr:2OG-Fe(II) oxygenase [Streptomyces sp. B1I3]MDQ0797259.1 hypothetical protein [Streptomyces sp. B1I3]